MPTESSRLNYTSLQTDKVAKNLLYWNQIYDYYEDKKNSNQENEDIIRHTGGNANTPRNEETKDSSKTNFQIDNEYPVIKNDNSVEFESSHLSKSTRMKAVSPKVFDPNESVAVSGKNYSNSDKINQKEKLKYIALYRQAIRNSNGHNRSQTEINLSSNIDNYDIRVQEGGERNKQNVENWYSLSSKRNNDLESPICKYAVYPNLDEQ